MKRLLRNGQYNFDACVATVVLATTAVALRFFVRGKMKQAASLSEWLCLVGLVFFYAYCGTIIYYIVNLSPQGNGNFDALQFPSPFDLVPLLRILFIAEIFFSVAITAVKISILCFYYQIFAVSKTFRWAVYATGASCIVWLIVVLFVIIFQCSPIHAFWDYISSPLYCHASAPVLLGYEVSNLIVDVIILLLPVLMVRTLQLPLWRKMSVAGIFLLGGFVCVASVVRVTRIWRPPHPEINIHLPSVIMWSTIQIGTAIICACLPTYGPILKSQKIQRVITLLMTSFRSSDQYTSPSSSDQKRGSSSPWKENSELSWHRLEDGQYTNTSKIASNTEGDFAMEPVPSNSLSTVKTVHVS